MNLKYQGVILGKTPTDYVLGGAIELAPLTDYWEEFLIGSDYKLEHEMQRPFGFETYACTCFAGNDVKELIMMWALKNNKIPREDVLWLSEKGYFRNGVINFDDRVPAMHAEIQKGLGTYLFKAGNALRKWSLPEGILKDTPKNFEEYMDLDRLTNEAKDLQKEYDKRFVWNWFWFDEFEGDVKQELKTSPAMSCVKFANGEGCLKPAGRVDHAVTEYKIDKCHHIDDSYIQQFKKYHPDYIKNRVGFKLTIKKHIKPMKIEDNKLYMLVEGPEQKLAMGLDGKLWVYDNKIDTLLNSASRSRQYQIPTPITKEQWESVPRVNGKGEAITN